MYYDVRVHYITIFKAIQGARGGGSKKEFTSVGFHPLRSTV